MTVATANSSGAEARFGEQEILVSKTDVKGRITYVNGVFERVSGYSRDELLGKPHSAIRHSDMPGAIFKLLWDTITAGDEIFAYVKNITKAGGFYWVLAHVTPSYDASGRVVGYHSNRRYPDRESLARIEPVYRGLRQVEGSYPRKAEAAAAALSQLQARLQAGALTYEQYVWRIIRGEGTDLDD